MLIMKMLVGMVTVVIVVAVVLTLLLNGCVSGPETIPGF